MKWIDYFKKSDINQAYVFHYSNRPISVFKIEGKLWLLKNQVLKMFGETRIETDEGDLEGSKIITLEQFSSAYPIDVYGKRVMRFSDWLYYEIVPMTEEYKIDSLIPTWKEGYKEGAIPLIDLAVKLKRAGYAVGKYKIYEWFRAEWLIEKNGKKINVICPEIRMKGLLVSVHAMTTKKSYKRFIAVPFKYLPYFVHRLVDGCMNGFFYAYK